MIKMYITIGDQFIMPGFIHYWRSYMKGCHICQSSRNNKPPVTQLQQRIKLNYRPLSRLGIHLKVMPKSHKGHKFILCITDEVTHYSNNCTNISFQIRRNGSCLNRKYEISIYCILDYIIMDLDSTVHVIINELLI